MSSLVKVRDLKKVFLTEEVETHALSQINLDINSGEYLAITGPSGCGKSTLLSILGLLDSYSEGQYTLNGRDVARDLSSGERAKIRNKEIGFVFQSFNLISDLTVAENVALPMTYRNDISKQERENYVETALQKIEMLARRNHYPAQLSGGQQQRVAVARAIASSPAIILADEPTGNLDSENAKKVLDLFAQLHQEGATICMVTHDVSSISEASRIVKMFDGKVVDENDTVNRDVA